MSAAALGSALLAAAAAGVVAWPGGAAPAGRLRRLARAQPAPDRSTPGSSVATGAPWAGGQSPEVPGELRGSPVARRLRTVAPLLAAAGVSAVAPSVLGLLLAAGVAASARLLLRRLAAREAGGDPARAVDLPPVLDLLAACLAAGAPLRSALAVVGEAAPPPLGSLLRTAAGALALGSPPEAALAGLTGTAGLERLAGVLARAEATGAAPTDQLAALAEDTRRAAQDSARAAARRAGVLVVLPLGLCFLPAFVLLGVVPVVAGVADQVLP